MIVTISFSTIKGRSWGSGVLVNNTLYYSGGECTLLNLLILKFQREVQLMRMLYLRSFINLIFPLPHLSSMRLIIRMFCLNINNLLFYCS
jgi:hypothetical protein